MANQNRNEINQPPSGEGKKQNKYPGKPNKLHKRAEVLQAAGAEQNIGSAEDEDDALSAQTTQAGQLRKPRAGR